jgi:hypothetical protein
MISMLKQFRTLSVFLFLTPWLLYAQDHSGIGETLQQKEIHTQEAHPPASQKLFLHLDNNNYSAGETIWFKGYLTDGVTHKPDSSGANIYVELWNVHGELEASLIAQPYKGSFHGEFFLDADIPDGNYLICAYTDQMANLPDAFWFRRYLYISNPDFANRIDNSTRRANRNFNKELDKLRNDFLISFYPEGGRLINGIETMITVVAKDATGRGIKSEGEIINQSGSVIATFSTRENGLGHFVLQPVSQNTYTANIRISGNKTGRFPLPEVFSEGYKMKINVLPDQIVEVNIQGVQSIAIGKELLLKGHSRGDMIISDQGELVNGAMRKQFPLADFPTGIIHFTLYSHDNTLLAERPLFVNHHDQVYFDMRASSTKVDNIPAINIELLPSDINGQPVHGDFSIAVQFSKSFNRIYDDNIFSYFMLTSELKELIENPSFYFDFNREYIEKETDLLMQSNNWQRLSWQKSDKYDKTQTPLPSRHGISLSGSALDPSSLAKIKNTEIILRPVADREKSFFTITDSEGKFRFDNLPLLDSVLIEILAISPEDEFAPEIILDIPESNTSMIDMSLLEPNYLTQHQKITERGRNWRRPRPESRTTRGRESTPSPYGSPDQTVYPDGNIAYSNITDLLRDKATGLTFSPNGNIIIRGPSSIGFQAPPIFIVDGIESQGSFMALDVRNVEKIEIFKGGRAAVFGARGVNGALVAYTRRGESPESNTSQNQFLVSGLHVPAEYTHDLKSSSIQNLNDKPATIWWQPTFQTDEDGVGSFLFFPQQTQGQYRIIIQGISKEGKVGYGEFIIEL